MPKRAYPRRFSLSGPEFTTEPMIPSHNFLIIRSLRCHGVVNVHTRRGFHATMCVTLKVQRCRVSFACALLQVLFPWLSQRLQESIHRSVFVEAGKGAVLQPLRKAILLTPFCFTFHIIKFGIKAMDGLNPGLLLRRGSTIVSKVEGGKRSPGFTSWNVSFFNSSIRNQEDRRRIRAFEGALLATCSYESLNVTYLTHNSSSVGWGAG